MTAAELFNLLLAQGVTLTVGEDQVRCRGKQSALTPEVLAQVREHKLELLRLLNPEPLKNHSTVSTVCSVSGMEELLSPSGDGGPQLTPTVEVEMGQGWPHLEEGGEACSPEDSYELNELSPGTQGVLELPHLGSRNGHHTGNGKKAVEGLRDPEIFEAKKPFEPPCPYEYVTSPLRAEELVRELALAPVVGVDTETIRFGKKPSKKSGKGSELSPPDLFRDQLRLVQMATPGGAWVFDLKQVSINLLIPVFTSPGLKVFHTAQFDMAFIHQATGVMPAPAFCTMLADQLLRTRRGDAHGLKDVAPYYLGQEVLKEEQLSDWSLQPLREEQLGYAALDAAVLIPLHEKLRAKISAKGLERVLELELDLLPAVTEMWEKGIVLDWPSWETAYRLREAEQKAAATALAVALPEYFTPEELVEALRNATKKKELSGTHQKALDVGNPLVVNWRSSHQITALLKGLGVELPQTPTGLFKLDRAMLAGAQDKHALIPLLIPYRAAGSMMSKCGLDWKEKYISPVTGHIHASFHQCGTVTGRLSISNPGLHSTPRKGGYRECYRPLPGHTFLIYDWSQVEVRIVAEICGDENLIDIFRAGEDIYVAVATKLFKIAGRPPTEEERQKAKAVVLGQNYGQSANGLVHYAANVCQIDISQREARKLIEDYFNAFPKLKQWQQEEEAKLAKLGELDTETPMGRRRTVRLGSYDSPESGKEVLNSPIQGAGADCLKLAMVLLYQSREELPGASVVLPVHDELVYQIPIEGIELGKKRLAWAMDKALRDAALKSVPTGVSPAKIVVSDCWRKI